MPPRFAFWTILLDGQPTAFRARDKEELLPTLRQLRSTNPGAIMKWFANGRLWESPEEALEARARRPAPDERRGTDWRPGGKHEDPRARFKSAGKAAPTSAARRPRPAGDAPREAAGPRRAGHDTRPRASPFKKR